MDFLFQFCFATAGSLPYRLLAYYPYRRQLRFPLWVVALVVGVAQFLQSFLYAWLTVSGNGGVGIMQAIFAPACFVIFLICVNADFWKVLFLYIFIFDYTALVRSAARYAECLLFYSPGLTFDIPRSLTFQLAVLAISGPFMVLFFRRTKDRVFQTDAPSFWRVIWILPAFTTLIVSLNTSDASPEHIRQFRFFLTNVLLLAGMISVYFILIRALDVIRKEAALEEKAAQQEHLLALQRTQYSQISRYMEETREARHDLSQHLRLINEYLRTGSTDALRDYVAHYEASLPPVASHSFCKNYAVNTILSYYYEEAINAGVSFSVQLELPETLPISEPEFCSMLGNLLENALLSCRETADDGTAPFTCETEGDRTASFIRETADAEIAPFTCETASNRTASFTRETAGTKTAPFTCETAGTKTAPFTCETAGAKTAPFIRVLAKTDDSFLWLALDNTCLREPVQKDGRFLSSRHDGFGVGTASIAATAERGGGSCDFEYKNGVFYASVSLALAD